MEYGSFATLADGVWTSLFQLIIYLVVSTQLSVVSYFACKITTNIWNMQEKFV